MNFKEFFQENNDYHMSHTALTLAKNFIEQQQNWIRQMEEYIRSKDVGKVLTYSQEYFKLQEIVTPRNTLTIVYNKYTTTSKGSVALDTVEHMPTHINLNNDDMFNANKVTMDAFKYLTRHFREERALDYIKDGLERLKKALSKNYTEIVETVGHEISHVLRYDNDIYGDKSQEELDNVDDRIQGETEEERNIRKYRKLKIKIKKFQKEIYEKHSEKIKKLPWYAYLTYLKYKLTMEERLDDVSYDVYANSSVEIDARFLTALFPFLRQNFTDFRDMSDLFVQRIGEGYWERVTEKNRRAMLRRLYKFWEYKKSN